MIQGKLGKQGENEQAGSPGFTIFDFLDFFIFIFFIPVTNSDDYVVRAGRIFSDNEKSHLEQRGLTKA